MTVVVAAQTRRGITMAADTQTTTGWTRHRHNTPKLWTDGRYLTGWAGTLRDIQVIRHWTTWPKHPPGEDVETFAVRKLVPALRSAVADAGVMETDDGRESIHACGLIAWGHNLVAIDGDWSVFVPHQGRIAIGSGSAEALGALGDDGPWTDEQVYLAAKRASELDVYCGGPIHWADTDKLTVWETA